MTWPMYTARVCTLTPVFDLKTCSHRKMVVGTACGSIQIWNCFGNSVNSRPLGAVFSAHGGTAKQVTFVTFSRNGERIASRSESDNTVRVWDVSQIEKMGALGRKYRTEDKGEPISLLAVCNGLPALNGSANCSFSPDGSILCAGSSVDPRAGKSTKSNNVCGKVKFYRLPEENRSKHNKEAVSKSSSKRKNPIAVLDPLEEVSVSPNASVLGVQWHPKLNQIALGTSNGM